MTIQTKTNLKSLFENGDTPSGTNFGDMIDSSVNLAETSIQTMNGNLYTPELVTGKVSAATVNVTGTLTATTLSPTTVNATTVNASTVSAATASIGSLTTTSGTINATTLNATTASATTLTAGTVAASGATFTTLNATTINATQGSGTSMTIGTLGATNLNVSNASAAVLYASRLTGGVVTVSGIGSAQGGAQLLTEKVSVLITNSAEHAFILPGGYPGNVQYIRNNSVTVSARIYPPTGGTINGLGSNAAYRLPGSTRMMVVHQSSAAFNTWRCTE